MTVNKIMKFNMIDFYSPDQRFLEKIYECLGRARNSLANECTMFEPIGYVFFKIQNNKVNSIIQNSLMTMVIGRYMYDILIISFEPRNN